MALPRLINAFALGALVACAPAAEPPSSGPSTLGQNELADLPRRPVATYSIVARDAKTGELGVAVQSHWFSVGSLVPWAEAGVGAVATQSFVDPSYGPLALDMLRAGRGPKDALMGLVAADSGRGVRQVAVVSATGEVAAHTGDSCIPAAGHHIGDGFSVQANLMESATVWPAMAKAFEGASGSLAERMLVAMEAAEAEGGDIRGKQSAAILVVKGESSGKPWEDKVVDLRVEDHPDPLKEMARLLRLQGAYREMNAGDLALERGDLKGALAAYGAAESQAPEVYEIPFWVAVTLASEGKVEDAKAKFAIAFGAEPRLRGLIPRLPGVGLLPKDDDLIEAILAIEPGEKP